MAEFIGINGTGDGEIAPDSLRFIGAAWERLVLLERFDLNPYIDACHANGITVVAVVARESLGIQPSAERWSMAEWLASLGQAHTLTETPSESQGGTMSYSQAAQFYRDRYGGKLDVVQVGNESDHESPSSWTMSHDDLNNLIFAFNQEFPRATIIGPGLVSGDPSFVRGMDLSLIDGVACLVPDQRVTASAPTRATMRRYEGDVVTIKTTSGNQVTCTPNHPILTRHGWVPARDIHEGAEIAQYAVGYTHRAGPYDVNVPTAISEVFRSMNQSGVLNTRLGVRFDFHGDGSDSDINVVTPHRLLGNTLAKTFQDVRFTPANVRLVPLPGQSASSSRFFREQRDAGNWIGQFPPLNRFSALVGPSESDVLSLAFAARHQAATLKQDIQSAITDSEIAGDGDHRFPRHIARMQCRNVSVRQHTRSGGLTLIPDVKTTLFEQGAEATRATADRRGDGLDGLPGHVAFVQVAEVGIGQFDGHVYNLTTQDGLIGADGIVTHNCHPYGQRPGDNANWSQLPGNFGNVNNLLDRYSAEAGGLPLWVTEVGVSTTEVSAEFQGYYCHEMMATLKARPDVEGAFWFCLGDWMVPEFGIMDSEGRLKPAAAAFTAVAGALPPLPPEPPTPPKPPEPPMPETITIPEQSYRAWWTAVRHDAEYNPGNGFETYWREHMGELGAVLNDHEFSDGGYQWRTFEHGALRWSPEKGVEMVLRP